MSVRFYSSSFKNQIMDISILQKVVAEVAASSSLWSERNWPKLQGQKLSAIVELKSNPHEYAKFRMHLEDLDHINGLFFSLRTRLIKIEDDLLEAEASSEQLSNLEAKVSIDLNLYSLVPTK